MAVIKFALLSLALSLTLTFCYAQNYHPAGLRKITADEKIDFFKNKIYPTALTIFKDTSGNLVLNKDSLDPTEISYDYYVNSKNEIIECVSRKSTAEDKAVRKKMMAIFEEQQWGVITPAKIPCEQQAEVLKEILVRDQNNGRIRGKTVDAKVDKDNLEKVLGIIQECGFPDAKKVGKEGMMAVFYVLQHGTHEAMEKYISKIKQSALNGDLSLKEVALMEDRILMENGEKQKYGTQIILDSKTGHDRLYPLCDPKNVNERRKSMGLGTIEEYTHQFNVEFKPE